MVKENLLPNPDLLYSLLFFKAFLSSPVPLPSKLFRIRTANLATAQPEGYSLRAQKDYFWQASGFSPRAHLHRGLPQVLPSRTTVPLISGPRVDSFLCNIPILLRISDILFFSMATSLWYD